MQGKQHKPEQIVRKLREADAMLAADKSIGQVTQALEISFYWPYGSLSWSIKSRI